MLGGRSSDQRVPLLDYLSGPLFRELQFERHRQSFCKIRVVDELLEAPDMQILEALHSVSASLTQLVAATGDVVFLSGSHAQAAYFKISGSLMYYSDDGKEEVGSSRWIAEACFWTPWIHLGDCEATDVSEFLSLDAQGFLHSLCKSWSTQRAAITHAKLFVDAWSSEHRNGSS